MDKLIVISALALILLGALALSNMKTEAPTAGRIIEKEFIPYSQIQDMAYSRLQDAVFQNKTALIFFYDSTCDVCIAQIAEIDSLLEHFQNTDPKFLDNFTYYEYDFYTGLRDKFNVTNHHTLILIKEGKEILRTREALTKDELLGKITSA